MRRDVKKTNKPMGSIRVISGQYRGRKLPVLNADGLRPTTDRTKETLFNWLMNDVRDSHCLDLFAGSASLGIEALSRHAANVTFVEMNKDASAQINQNLNLLKVPTDRFSVLQGDATQVVTQLKAQFDIVFLDPPFHKNLLPEIINLLAQLSLVRDGSLLYIECELEHANYTVPQSWQRIKESQTKQLSYRLYQVVDK